jgi:hypothetical protein
LSLFLFRVGRIFDDIDRIGLKITLPAVRIEFDQIDNGFGGQAGGVDGDGCCGQGPFGDILDSLVQ